MTRFRRSLPLLLLALVVLVQLLCVPGHYLGAEHDDAQYVLSSRSLLHGRYSLGISPGDPAVTFNTPGWPVLLLPAAAVSGESPAGYELWAWAWLALCDVLAWLWLSRRLGRALGAAALALFALNPLVLSRSGVAMCEVPALAAVLGLLLLLERRPASLGARSGPQSSWIGTPQGRREAERCPPWASGLWLGAAWLVRPAVLALWPGVLGKYAVERRWKDLGWSALCAGLPVLAWKAWVGAHGEGLAETKELALSMGRGASELLRIAAWNAREALATWGHTVLPLPPASIGDVAALCAGAVLAAAALAGMAARVRRRGYDAAAAYVAAGVGMHVLWPYWYERYLVPFLPFLAWGLAEAALLLARRRGGARRAAAAGLGLAAALCLPQCVLLLRSPASPAPELKRTYAWIRERTAPADVFASPFYARDAFYAGRPFVPLPDAGVRERLRSWKVRYVLWQEPGDLGSSRGPAFALARRLASVGAELGGPGYRRVYSSAEEGTSVYEVGGP